MVDRIDHRRDFPRALAVSDRHVGQRGPDRGMRVLAAILANARRIPFDISRVGHGLIERRREQQHQPFVAPDKIFFHRRHGPAGARRFARARNDAP